MEAFELSRLKLVWSSLTLNEHLFLLSTKALCLDCYNQKTLVARITSRLISPAHQSAPPQIDEAYCVQA